MQSTSHYVRRRLNRDVGTKEMNIRNIAAMIPLLCLVGCASNDEVMELSPAMRSIMAQEAESHFPLPATTPYDADANRRDQYLQGYKDGVHERISRMDEKEWSAVFPPPTNEDERPHFDGFKDGMSAKPQNK